LLGELAYASGLGWSLALGVEDKNIVFQVLEGVDRSYGNTEGNESVMFNPRFGNVKLLAYLNTNVNSKNVNYVAGQGEANTRSVEEVAKDAGSYTGMRRREVFTDARDLDSVAKLQQRGNERLAEVGEEEALEMENLSTGPFSYGTDFYLGDIITVRYPGIMSGDFRLIESIIEITPGDLIQNKLIVGRSAPDIIRLYKYDKKNINTEIRR
jgi:hypothetical protein